MSDENQPSYPASFFAAMKARARTVVANAPPHMPWGPIVTYCVTGVVMSLFMMARDLSPAKWAIPGSDQLQYASGAFLPREPGAAYLFKTDGGRTLSLGCEPQGFGAQCFDDAAAGNQHLTLGYFYVHNAERPNLSDILVTVTFGDRQLLGYAERKKQLGDWARHEKSLSRLLFSMVLDLLPMFVLGGIAIAGARSKIARYNRSAHIWG
jgi:hypothetical protein